MYSKSFHDRFSTGTKKREGIPKKWEGILESVGTPWEWIFLLILAFDVVFGLVRPFVVEPMQVPSESMSPTLETSDRVLTNKLAYDLKSPARGDLVVFESVEPEEDEYVVKRVVGLPGDEVRIVRGDLLVNGVRQQEPYAASGTSRTTGGRGADREARVNIESFGPETVPEDHVFVLGDNRANSYDSRFFGPVPQEKLVGEPSLRFWPPGRVGTP